MYLQEKLAQISGQMQQLLALLTACTTSTHATSVAVVELQSQALQLQKMSQEANMHLACMGDALQLMADQGATAADVDFAMRQLHSTMLDVGDAACQEVQRVCGELQHRLSKDVAVFAVDQLRGSVDEIATELKGLERGMEKLEEHAAAEAQLTREEMHDGHACILAVRRSITWALCVVLSYTCRVRTVTAVLCRVWTDRDFLNLHDGLECIAA